MGETQTVNVPATAGRRCCFVCRECKAEIVAMFRDDGFPPDTLLCRSCGAGLAHLRSDRTPGAIVPTVELYRPSEDELGQEVPGRIQSILSGRLLARDIDVIPEMTAGFSIVDEKMQRVRDFYDGKEGRLQWPAKRTGLEFFRYDMVAGLVNRKRAACLS